MTSGQYWSFKFQWSLSENEIKLLQTMSLFLAGLFTCDNFDSLSDDDCLSDEN